VTGGARSIEIPPLASASGAAAPRRSGVRFGHPPAAVGSRTRTTLLARSRSSHGSGEQIVEYASEYVTEVLAVEGPAASRLRVRFLRNGHRHEGSLGSSGPTALEGNTYLIDKVGPTVSDPSGQVAPPEQAQLVLDMFPDIGTRARTDEVLPDEAMGIGDRRDELAAAILRMAHPRRWTLLSGSAVLARREGDEAVFQVQLDAESESHLRMTVAGDARVRIADAHLSLVALAGTFAPASPSALDAGAPDGSETNRFTFEKRIVDEP